MSRSTSINWHAYPLALSAGCVASGIVLAQTIPVSFGTWALCMLVPIGLVILGWWQTRRRLVSLSKLWITLAAATALVVLGGSLVALENARPPHHITHLLPNNEHEVQLYGEVASPARLSAFSKRFTLSTALFNAGSDTLQVIGKIEVTLVRPRRSNTTAFPELRPGIKVSVYGRLEPVPQRRNPADFDYGSYLTRRGIHATMRLTEGHQLVIEDGPTGWTTRLLSAAKEHIRASLEQHTPTPFTSHLLSALLLGNRSTLDPEIRNTFRQTGLTHLLAISGLHVMLLGFVVHALLKGLLLRLGLSWFQMELIRSGLTLGVLIAYVLVSGAQPSAIRATVMGLALMGSHIVQRPTEPINTLGLAALFLLLVDPNQLFAPGFQLSFAAVGALVSLVPALKSWIPEFFFSNKGLRWTTTLTLASVAATLGTLPVLLVHFGYVSFAGLILNVLAIPLTTFLLASGVFLILSTPVDSVATLFGYAADAFAHGLLAVAQFGDAFLSWAAIHQYLDDAWLVLAFVAGLFIIVHGRRPRYRWRLAAACLLFTGIGIWVDVGTERFRPRLDVVFLDVGQGDAALIRTPDGRHVLIDAGPRTPYTDAGTRTLLPHLERYGIEHIDAVVITHAHADHLGGLPSLLRAASVGRILHNGLPGTSNLYEETLHLVDSLGVAFEAVSAGDTLQLDPYVQAQVLWPADPTHIHQDANNGSIVLRLAFGETAFLFTGDIEAEAEAYLTEHYQPFLESDVVKVPHHGSRTSSTDAFVHAVTGFDQTSPIAIISVAERNRFGLPNTDVIARWTNTSTSVLLTSDQGAIWLQSNGQSIQRVIWR